MDKTTAVGSVRKKAEQVLVLRSKSEEETQMGKGVRVAIWRVRTARNMKRRRKVEDEGFLIRGGPKLDFSPPSILFTILLEICLYITCNQQSKIKKKEKKNREKNSLSFGNGDEMNVGEGEGEGEGYRPRSGEVDVALSHSILFSNIYNNNNNKPKLQIWLI